MFFVFFFTSQQDEKNSANEVLRSFQFCMDEPTNLGMLCTIWFLHLVSQLLATPGPFEYFGQNWVSSENQSCCHSKKRGFPSCHRGH